MATSDLCNELNKDTELGPYFEPKYVSFISIMVVFCRASHTFVSLRIRVCAAVLKQLDDKSNDVQSIAVKWCVTPLSLSRSLFLLIATDAPPCALLASGSS